MFGGIFIAGIFFLLAGEGIDCSDAKGINDTLASFAAKLPQSLSPKCLQDLYAVTQSLKDLGKGLVKGLGKDLGQGLDKDAAWVIKFLDSYGKPPAGVTQFTLIWPGDYSECKAINASYNIGNLTSGNFKGDFAIASIKIPASLLQPGAKGFFPYPFRYGYCLPDSCDPTALMSMFEFLPMSSEIKQFLKNGTYEKVPDGADWDWRGIFALVFASIFVFVIILATLYDIFTRINENMAPTAELLSYRTATTPLENGHDNAAFVINDEEGNPHLNKTNKAPAIAYSSDAKSAGLLSNLLLCFSAYKNGEKILDTSSNKKSISCLHGIRFLSMSWVILGHTYFFAIPLYARIATVPSLMNTFAFQVISVGGSFSVDTFFLLSGTLVSYLFYQHLDSVGSLKKIGWVKFYLHRIWRLTPAYMLILFLSVCLFRYLGSGPLWKFGGQEYNFCEDTWWTNLLYINNFVRQKNMCMGWTWYLANDMQFYIISPLILIPLALFKIAGFAVIAALLVVSWGVSAYVIDYFNLASQNALQLDPHYMADFYMKPYIRIGPYLIGLVLGYIILKTKFKFKMNKIFVVLGWSLATAMNLSVVYGMYHAYPTLQTVKVYDILSRSAWAIGVGWVIFACVNGYGGFVNTLLSWKAFIPLSRLTYCAYLIHPVVMYYFYFTRHTPIDPNQAVLVPYFFSHMCVAYGIAFILSIAFESPMMNIEKVLLQKKKD